MYCWTCGGRALVSTAACAGLQCTVDAFADVSEHGVHPMVAVFTLVVTNGIMPHAGSQPEGSHVRERRHHQIP